MATNNPSDNKTNDRKKNVLIYGILILALIATWAYIYWDKSRNTQTQQELQSQVIELDSSKSAVKEQYQATLVKLDLLKTENDSLIKTKSKEIEDLKARIQSILSKQNASQTDLKEAKSLINQLKNRIAGYKSEIERLQGENIALTAQRDSLKVQRDSLQSNYQTATAKNDSLHSKIKIAANLKAAHFDISPIHIKNSGKETTTDKAKRTDILRIQFNIEKNELATSGKKELFICINSPEGTPIAVEEMGSGRFMLKDSTEKLYTLKTTIDYQQGQPLPVTVNWKQSKDFKPGTYAVSVYENGERIGESSVKLEDGFFIF
ncbi:MAG TPA: hypothetical protein VK084_05150 [Chitinophagaceae bacterium]|nr:hypothetical protein [Chitinophagaceae bacterium]